MSLEKFNENDMKYTVGNPHNPYFYAGCIIYTHFWTFEALIKIWPDANFLLIFSSCTPHHTNRLNRAKVAQLNMLATAEIVGNDSIVVVRYKTT